MRGWKVDDGDGGWQDDDTLTFNGKNEDLNFKQTILKMFSVQIMVGWCRKYFIDLNTNKSLLNVKENRTEREALAFWSLILGTRVLHVVVCFSVDIMTFRVLHISAGEGDSCQQRPSSRVTARSSGSLQQTSLCRCMGEHLE